MNKPLSLEERKQLRFRLLRTLYRASEGSTSKSIKWKEVPKRLDGPVNAADQALEYLVNEGLAEWVSMGHVALTHYGVTTVEREETVQDSTGSNGERGGVPDSNQLPTLLQPPDAVRAKLIERVAKGRDLLEWVVRSDDDARGFNIEYEKWNEYNETLLMSLLTGDRALTDYQWSTPTPVRSTSDATLDIHMRYVQDLDAQCQHLESLVDRLDLLPLADGVSATPSPGQAGPTERPLDRIEAGDRRIFVVHGHAVGRREEVARFLERLGLEPVILHEQADQGRTIIEKFEAHSNAPFAVVIATPDDPASEDGPKGRPRQNVILELGFFLGSLGRENVVVLAENGVELPSDYSGVIYVPLSQSDWPNKLAREIKNAGFEIEADALL